MNAGSAHSADATANATADATADAEAVPPARDSLFARTAKGAGWVIGWRMVTRSLGLVSTLVLVRLLQPADFGLVTLAMSFAAAVDSLSALGVEEAVVREPDASRDLYDSAFTINVLRACATAAVIAAAAWPVARFFDDMRLFGVVLVVAAGALVGGFENIGVVDFRRELRFDKEFILLSVPRVISIAVAIGLALVWHSYWALVCAIQTVVLLRTALGYLMHPFRPRLRLPAWRRIAAFSFWSWLLSLGGLVSDRAPGFVIGRLSGLAAVGVFSVGAEIAELPTTELIQPLSRACFSAFAASGTHGLAATFLRVIGGTTLIALPAGVGLSLVADPIVKLAFGANWDGAIGVVRILGIALTSAILGHISIALLTSQALLKQLFRVRIAAIAARFLLLVLLAWPFGLIGAAVAVGVGTALEHLVIFATTLKHLHVPYGGVARATWRSLAGASGMALGLYTLGLGWNANTGPADLAMAVPAGALIYAGIVGLCWLCSGRPDGAERDILGLVEERKRFFFEKNKQKTFIHLAPERVAGSGPG